MGSGVAESQVQHLLGMILWWLQLVDDIPDGIKGPLGLHRGGYDPSGLRVCISGHNRNDCLCIQCSIGLFANNL